MPRIRRKNIDSQFWARIDQRGENECWPFNGSLSHKRYGAGWFKVNGVVYRVAHRASWAIHYGPPGDLHVCHSCDNPPCVNPRHLFLGTNVDNVNDRVAKGRTQRGSKHFLSRLTEDDVRTIRVLVQCQSQSETARQYGVSVGTVSAIVHGRSWKHLK
jgi:hypothetical protein